MSVQTITLDPVSRIEGHLRIDLDLDNGKVRSARSSGSSFRGFEIILVGRDPRDAPQLTQRICGVCPIPHARASTAAFESAAQLEVNQQARLIRNVLEAINFIDSHLLHFYLLALPDFVSGLPSAGGRQSQPRVWEGRAGLSAQTVAEHVGQSFAIRRRCGSLIALLGGKMPHPVGIVPGGATASVTATSKATLSEHAAAVETFVREVYRADVEALANAFSEYLNLGASGAGFLSFGGYPEVDGRLALPRGVIWPESAAVTALDVGTITESVAHGRYTQDVPRHPASGATQPDLQRGADAYTWLKAPRLSGRVCEVGPLARATVAGVAPAGRGVHGRHLARVAEAMYLAERVKAWISELVPDASACPSFPRPPVSGQGFGLVEAPRGALGHFLTIENSVIKNYQVISPTTWNGSPRDENNLAGPMEKALEGIEVADTADPIEVLRVIHSFDPCLQCSVH